MKNVAIFSGHLSGWLQMKGFVLCGMEKNSDGSGRFVYFFRDSESIRSAMRQHSEMFKKFKVS